MIKSTLEDTNEINNSNRSNSSSVEELIIKKSQGDGKGDES
jgi:hypothetical protein